MRFAAPFVILVLSGLFALRCGATVYQSDGSAADVQRIHDKQAHDGDTITLPAGTFSWSRGVTIDEVRIYHRALSVVEIQTYINTPVTPIPSPTPANNTFLTGLYAYYALDEASGNAFDASGNGHDLSQSGPIGSGAGKINNARSWSGGFSGPFLFDDRSTTTFQPGSSDFFVTCWIKSATTTYNYDAGIAGKFILPNASWLLYRRANGGGSELRFVCMSDGGSNGSEVVGPVLNDTNWHFIVAGWDGTNVKISVDGGAYATVLFAGPVFGNGTGAFQIGAEAASNTWNGLIDEVAIWIGRNDLTISEVRQLYNNGAGLPFSSYGSASAARAPVVDVNGDGSPDLVLQNTSTHQTAIWYLNNNVLMGGAYGPTLPNNWGLRGAADFNGDRHADYALFNPSADQTGIWYLSGPTRIASAYGPRLPSGWELVATADFNGDGYPDYVLYSASTRQTAIWYLNNNIWIGSAYGPTLPNGWSLIGAADFNRDTRTDYLLFYPTTGQTAIWYLSGRTLIAGALGPTVPSGWLLVATADFDGDGKPDYLLYKLSTRQTAIWYLNNNVYTGFAYGPTLPVGWSLTTR